MHASRYLVLLLADWERDNLQRELESHELKMGENGLYWFWCPNIWAEGASSQTCSLRPYMSKKIMYIYI